MLSKFLRNAAAVICVLSIVACATIEIDLPSVTDAPSSERLPGKIIWRDLLTHDLKGSQEFYGSLFGWEFEAVGSASGFASDSAYTLIRHNGVLIGGMIDTVALNGKDDVSQWIVVMSVDDVGEASASFATSGGEVITPPTDLRRRGRLAVVRDAEGALLGLLQTKDGDPADSEPVVDGFLWDELWTSDVDRATEFYTGVTGLKVDERHFERDRRRVLRIVSLRRVRQQEWEYCPIHWRRSVRFGSATCVSRVQQISRRKWMHWVGVSSLKRRQDRLVAKSRSSRDRPALALHYKPGRLNKKTKRTR